MPAISRPTPQAYRHVERSLQMDFVALPRRGCRVPSAFVQPTQSTHDLANAGINASANADADVSERLHAQALTSFREARCCDAHGRFVSLADAGQAPSARLALWMDLIGPSIFDKDWGTSPQQSTAWAKLAGQPTATLVTRSYLQTLVVVARNQR